MGTVGGVVVGGAAAVVAGTDDDGAVAGTVVDSGTADGTVVDAGVGVEVKGTLVGGAVAGTIPDGIVVDSVLEASLLGNDAVVVSDTSAAFGARRKNFVTSGGTAPPVNRPEATFVPGVSLVAGAVGATIWSLVGVEKARTSGASLGSLPAWSASAATASPMEAVSPT